MQAGIGLDEPRTDPSECLRLEASLLGDVHGVPGFISHVPPIVGWSGFGLLGELVQEPKLNHLAAGSLSSNIVRLWSTIESRNVTVGRSSGRFCDAATRARANSIGVFPLSRPTSPFSIPVRASGPLGSLGFIAPLRDGFLDLVFEPNIRLLAQGDGQARRASDRKRYLLGTFHVQYTSLQLALSSSWTSRLLVAAAPASLGPHEHGSQPFDIWCSLNSCPPSTTPDTYPNRLPTSGDIPDAATGNSAVPSCRPFGSLVVAFSDFLAFSFSVVDDLASLADESVPLVFSSLSGLSAVGFSAVGEVLDLPQGHKEAKPPLLVLDARIALTGKLWSVAPAR